MSETEFSWPDISLRRAGKDDVDQYLRIEKAIETPYVLVTTDPKEALEEIQTSCVQFVYLREENAGLCGYSIRSESEGHVDELVILPQFQGKGIGSHVLALILDELRQKGITLVTLETHPENPALRLYERHGFIVTGHIENYQNSGSPRLTLSRDL